MRNLQGFAPSPASKAPPSRRAPRSLRKGTLMQNCLSPPKGTIFQGHTKRKALPICLAQQTRLTRQLRNSPRCLLASSVYPNQRKRRKRRKRAGDIAPRNLILIHQKHLQRVRRSSAEWGRLHRSLSAFVQRTSPCPTHSTVLVPAPDKRLEVFIKTF